MMDAPKPPPAACPSSIKQALTAAAGDTRSLLSGPGRWTRWKALFGLAAMAGVVGVGSAPPPLGLLQPVWEDPTLHAAVFGNRVVVGGLAFLAVFLVLMGGFARAFALGFVEGIATGRPAAGRYRAWLRRGVGHFVWSSALTLPLYAALFAAEAVVTRDTNNRLTALISSPYATEAELAKLLATAAAKFMLVLIPWTLITLPAMMAIYELVPAVMVRTSAGVLDAVRHLRKQAQKSPRLFLGCVGVRFLLQLAGNGLALIALAPCLLISSPAVVPLAGGGWWASAALGGAATNAGAAALTVGVLLAAVALYCVLCAALLPVSVFLYAFALRATGGRGVDQGA